MGGGRGEKWSRGKQWTRTLWLHVGVEGQEASLNSSSPKHQERVWWCCRRCFIARWINECPAIIQKSFLGSYMHKACLRTEGAGWRLGPLVRSLPPCGGTRKRVRCIPGQVRRQRAPPRFSFGGEEPKRSRGFKGTKTSQAGREGRRQAGAVRALRPSHIRPPKLVPSCQEQAEAQEKVGVSGEPLLVQRRRYLHETSTPGHQEPLCKAAGRTQGLRPARSRHLPARQCPAAASARSVHRSEVPPRLCATRLAAPTRQWGRWQQLPETGPFIPAPLRAGRGPRVRGQRHASAQA